MSHPTIDPFAALQEALAPQYRLERELGRGGMGVVFLATDTTLDRPVAIKVVHPELAAHASIVRRFLAEARTIARLRHPNIVAVHAAGTARRSPLLRHGRGGGREPAAAARPGKGSCRSADVARIVADIAAALDAAGRAGVVHRDVKPENVLLERGTGRALLADFGIARAMVAERCLQHRPGRGGGNAGLHEPRAGGGRGGGQPERPLRARRRRLRDAGGSPAVPGQQPRGRLQAHRRAAGPDRADPARVPAAARRRRHEGAGEAARAIAGRRARSCARRSPASGRCP